MSIFQVYNNLKSNKSKDKIMPILMNFGKIFNGGVKMKLRIDKTNKKSALINIGDASLYIYDSRTSIEVGVDHPFCDLHIHAGFEVQYVGAGSIIMHTEYGEFEATAGSVIIIPPNNYHQVSSKTKNFSRHCFSFSVFPNSEEEEGNEYVNFNRILSRITKIKVIKSEKLSHTMQRIMQSKIEEPAENDYIIYSLLNLFIMDVFDECKKILKKDKELSGSSSKGKRFNNYNERQRYIVENCLADHFAAENPIQIIEETLNTSKRNAARVVQSLFGENISDLVLKYRMKIAKMYIENSDMQLNSIAEKVGYKTYVAFFTAFKKYYKISPTEYRERLKAE